MRSSSNTELMRRSLTQHWCNTIWCTIPKYREQWWWICKSYNKWIQVWWEDIDRKILSQSIKHICLLIFIYYLLLPY